MQAEELLSLAAPSSTTAVSCTITTTDDPMRPVRLQLASSGGILLIADEHDEKDAHAAMLGTESLQDLIDGMQSDDAMAACMGCAHASELTRQDHEAHVELGMMVKPAHVHCHRCLMTARIDHDGSCSGCGSGETDAPQVLALERPLAEWQRHEAACGVVRSTQTSRLS